jgi:hypothetical protein
MHHLRRVALAFALSTFACGSQGRTPEKPADPGTPVEQPAKVAAKPTKGKPLTKAAKAGLEWLAKHQLPKGGWGQGDEAATMGNSMQNMRDTANVADTSIAVLAFLRAGQTARVGDYQDVVQHGIDYVLAEVENSDDTTLKVTSTSGTRVQMKIGAYADTFVALVMLDEARGAMRDGVADQRVDKAIRKIVKKIERNQRDDGGWEGQGWAPVLSQALAAKGLNRAAQNGIAVQQAVLDRVEKRAQNAVTAQGFAAGDGAGVELYGAAAASSTQRDSAATKQQNVKALKDRAAKAARSNHNQSPDIPTKSEIAHAEDEARASNVAAEKTEAQLVARMSDDRFVGGFGNNGGEEFLSYMLLSETLLQKGGEQWAKWDERVSKLVTGIQNDDGSWTGHHCITGRTFCTAAALLLLMADRAPVQATIAS